ncbi:MAG: hypothetical protein ABI333_04740 [bacterium]
MAGERALTLDFDAEIPLQAVAGQSYGFEARIYGTISGVVDSKVAAAVVDPQHQLPPAEIAGRIKANMIGWLQYAATAAFQGALQRPGVDLAAAIKDTGWLSQGIRYIVHPEFASWTFQTQEVITFVRVTDGCIAQLPPFLQQQLATAASAAAPAEAPAPAPEPPPPQAPAVAPAQQPRMQSAEDDAVDLVGDDDTAAVFGPIFRNFSDDVPAAADPRSGLQMLVRCDVQSFFTADPDRTRKACNVTGAIPPHQLCEMLADLTEPWIRYAVRQAFYNTLCDVNRQDVAVFADGHAMRDRCLALCMSEIKGLGVLTLELTVAYRSLDQATANTLLLPLPS